MPGRAVGIPPPGARLHRATPAEVYRYSRSRTNPNAPAVLREASAWYDARDLLSTTQQTLPNRNNPSATAAQLGSSSGSDTNDPLALTHSGTSYVYLPGTASNRLAIPDSAALRVTGDLDLRVRLQVSGPGGSIMSLVNKMINAGQLSYRFRYLTSGLLQLGWSADGTAVTDVSSTAILATFDTPVWVRATLDVDNGGGGYDVKFYTSSDGSTWTQLGATVTGGSTTSIVAGTDAVWFGSAALGRFYQGQIYNGIAGTKVLDVNPTIETLGQSSWTCTTGQTVTVDRSTTGLTTAVVTRPLLMADGTDDYVQLPAGDTPTFTATTGAYTVMLINRVHNLAGAATFSRVWSSESASLNGALILLDTTNARYSTGTGGSSSFTGPATVAFTQTTQLHAVAVVFDNGTAYAYSTTAGRTAGTSIAGVGTITHATPRVGSVPYAVATSDFENYATVHWTRALTATELDTAATYLLGSYS